MNRVIMQSSADFKDFHFKEDEKTILKLRYNPHLNTGRIESENEKRVFILEDEGLLKTKLILKNEYGVRLGQLVFDKWSNNQGTVEIENTIFRFVIRNTGPAELMIYKNSGRNLIYSCLLSNEFQGTTAKNHTASYILALSWYLVRQSKSIRHNQPELIV